MEQTGPGGIKPGSYDAKNLSQEQRNYLYRYFGNQGEAPIGYGGQGMFGDRGDIATGKARQDAIAPAVNSLNESVPEIQNRYSGQRSRLEANKQPLNERYSTLIDEIKGKNTNDVNQQTTVTRNEFGARGIPISSTNVQQELANKISGVNQGYSSILRNTELDRTEALKSIDDLIASLADSETGALRDVRNAIASLQSGAGNATIQDVLGERSYQDQQQQQYLDNQFRQSQADQSSRFQNAELDYTRQVQPIQLALQQLQLKSAQDAYTRKANQPTYKSSSDLMDLFT